MNKVQLMGRLVRDPELKTSANGKSYVRFTVAVDYAKDKEGNKLTNFVPCMAWDKRAEIISRYFLKGQRILVSAGMLMVRSYVDEHTQEKRSYTYVNVEDFEFVEVKSKGTTMGTEDVEQQKAAAPKQESFEGWFAMGSPEVEF